MPKDKEIPPRPEETPEKGDGKAIIGGDCLNIDSDVTHGCVIK